MPFAVDTVAAPAQSNTQQAVANSLSRKGRTTCGNRPRGEVIGEVIGVGVGEAQQEGQRVEGGACQQTLAITLTLI